VQLGIVVMVNDPFDSGSFPELGGMHTVAATLAHTVVKM